MRRTARSGGAAEAVYARPGRRAGPGSESGSGQRSGQRTSRALTVEGFPLRILVLGGDGYLGWPTAMYLSARGHTVGVLDNGVRRQYAHELGSGSLVPIETMRSRVRVWQERTGERIEAFYGDLLDAEFTYDTIREFAPDTLVHFAEQ